MCSTRCGHRMSRRKRNEAGATRNSDGRRARFALDSFTIRDAEIALECGNRRPIWQYAPIIEVHGRRFQVRKLCGKQNAIDIDTLEEVELDLEKVKW